MRTPLAIAAVLTGLVLWTVPAMAADVHRTIITAEKDVPTGPRICLFSQNGKRAETPPTDVADVEAPPPVVATNEATVQNAATPAKVEVAQSEPVAREQTPKEPNPPQTPNKVCDTDATTPAPHG
jgi:hypothetical protein